MSMDKNGHKYDDIIDLPHHRSAVRIPMSMHDRAAQFAPFAALTGHEEAIEDTVRQMEDRVDQENSGTDLTEDMPC